MAKTNYECGIGPAFDAIGGKWKVAILWKLSPAALRFGELKRAIVGVTEKMLTQQLRELERDGLITRTVFHEVPPRVEYALTTWGHSLNVALAPIADWGEAYALTTGDTRAETPLRNPHRRRTSCIFTIHRRTPMSAKGGPWRPQEGRYISDSPDEGEVQCP